MSIAQQIERYLLACGDWIPVREICRRFDIRERRLRALDDRPGLCSRFAISGDKGIKHVSCATTTEWLQFKHRLRKHGIGELVRVRDLDRRRQTVTTSIARPPLTFERDTNQAVLHLHEAHS